MKIALLSIPYFYRRELVSSPLSFPNLKIIKCGLRNEESVINNRLFLNCSRSSMYEKKLVGRGHISPGRISSLFSEIFDGGKFPENFQRRKYC